MKAYPTSSIPRSGCRKADLAELPRTDGVSSDSACAARATLGFTLVELLVSMVILLVLVGLLTVAFNSASKSWQQGERQVEQFQQARATLDLIASDLHQVMVTGNIQFYGNTNSLAFVAVNNDDTNSADLAEIVYQKSKQEPFKLWRRFTGSNLPNQPSGNPSPNWDFYTNPFEWPVSKDTSNLVCDGVVGLVFNYYDTNNTAHLSWNTTNVTAWMTGGEIPGGIPAGPPSGVMYGRPPEYIDIELDVVDNKTAAILPTLSGPALDNLTNTAKRTFHIFVKIPQR